MGLMFFESKQTLMATSARRQIQDQNLNILYSGPTPVQKMDILKADKKTRLAGRKVLNDISNSRNPSYVPLNPVKKDGSSNVISIEKDPLAVKAKLPKATEKGKVGGRKALTDVTNSVKPPAKHGLSTGRKLKEEGFLHNHQECIKAQANAVDVGYFLKSVGLYKDTTPMQLPSRSAIPLSSKKQESNNKNMHLIMEEVILLEDEGVIQCRSPACRSPQSPRAPYMSWDDDRFSELTMLETP